jgi:hypothetical protein
MTLEETIPIIDLSKYGHPKLALQSSLSLCLVLQKSFIGVFLSSSSFNKDDYFLDKEDCNLIHFIAEITKAKTKGVGVGSTKFLFEITTPIKLKKITIKEDEVYSSLFTKTILETLLPILLFANKKISFNLENPTHKIYSNTELNSIQSLKEYLRLYTFFIDSYDLQIPKIGFAPQKGNVIGFLHSKHNLITSPEINILSPEKLIFLRVDLSFSKNISLLVQERLLSLIELKLKIINKPIQLFSRTAPDESLSSMQITTYFGSEEFGFDNDFSFLRTTQFLHNLNDSSKKIQDIETYFLNCLNDKSIFLKELNQEAISSLLLVLALTGGKIFVADEILINSTAIKTSLYCIEKLLDVQIVYEKNHYTCKPFPKKELLLSYSHLALQKEIQNNNSSEIISLDDL